MTTKTEQAKQANRTRQFAAACQELRSALDRQADSASAPSMNVEACIYRVLAFNGDLGKMIAGRVTAAVIDSLAEATEGPTI